MRLQAEIDQLGMLRVVVMFLGFDARIRQVIDFDRQVQLLCRRLHHSRDFQNRKLLGELIKYPAFAPAGGFQAR